MALQRHPHGSIIHLKSPTYASGYYFETTEFIALLAILNRGALCRSRKAQVILPIGKARDIPCTGSSPHGFGSKRVAFTSAVTAFAVAASYQTDVQ
jgi:hypothetical protein